MYLGVNVEGLEAYGIPRNNKVPLVSMPLMRLRRVSSMGCDLLNAEILFVK
ncbi:hypothetical protein SAMN05421863_11061 [Nitrosomonas communis]|uniref:Uncharacterized protein n=2 Tax=Nitrosomonas communis TaxID=44574 RepID=A0A1I4WDL9_9PROT|nr:hypothetical protein SAMN05421863_11061 [Nitrosomonas communis]